MLPVSEVVDSQYIEYNNSTLIHIKCKKKQVFIENAFFLAKYKVVFSRQRYVSQYFTFFHI